MKTWETICNIEKNNKLHIIFSRKMILRSSMMPLLCSLRSSFRGAGSRRYRPSSPASMVPRILSFLFLVLCPSASSCDIPPPSSCTLVLAFVNNTTNTSVIKHALVPNGWVSGWLGGVVVSGWVVWWWVVVVVVVGGRRQRCIVPSGW